MQFAFKGRKMEEATLIYFILSLQRANNIASVIICAICLKHQALNYFFPIMFMTFSKIVVIQPSLINYANLTSS